MLYGVCCVCFVCWCACVCVGVRVCFVCELFVQCCVVCVCVSMCVDVYVSFVCDRLFGVVCGVCAVVFVLVCCIYT